MIAFGLRIEWFQCVEYVPINTLDIANCPNTIDTYWAWSDGSGVDLARAKSDVIHMDKGLFVLSLDFSKQNNQHIAENPSRWGTATIHIDINRDSGKATWKGKFTSEWNGDTEWFKIESGLLKPIRRKRVSIVERNQQRLRQALLAIDKVCALTGEANCDVLEAAHLIPSSAGGAEVLENAILLRADIHRLLDRKQIRIDANGIAASHFERTNTYADLNLAEHLPEKVITRVQKALMHGLFENTT